ncbi:3-oxoacyl-[acyl-carrier protein] reductase/pteridine reductase [Abditibacterium utsteinense]|uniref:3-oxoacyl-[acyl-carrier protein] reductase/pteridine reductase n=1 Tax=Abditibacterium utsteinense TaxID=1960156 RepID=A0A2S8SUR9_9BACT|nr:SDR family oxidoreductase [Abditibacterium utsteinense]PQV64543.1 3-oxoacyl-[acyl-carrier protein] reductase/pteridine reductase [Abditibacterium utsteinense]
MTISLQNQTVVVTGGAKRLGRAIALECARAGASVVITYRSSEAEARETIELLKATKNEATSAPIPQKMKAPRFEAFELEVSDAKAVARFSEEVFERFENVSGLVNNAAIFRRTPFDSMSEEDFDAHIDANLKGPFLMCRAFGREFMARGGGSIVNMADIYGIRPLANYVPYCVSKAGVIMLTQSLAKALAPRVRVNCIAPGTIAAPSELQGEADDESELIKRIPFDRLGTEKEIAEAALFLLQGPAFISGVVLPVDGAQILR